MTSPAAAGLRAPTWRRRAGCGIVTGMKNTLVASFSMLALVAAACSAGGAGGVYVLDKERVKAEMLAGQSEDAKKQPTFEQKLKELDSASMTIELKGDGSAAIVARGELLEGSSAMGSWQLEGTRLTITTKDAMTAKEESKTVDYLNGAFTLEVASDGTGKVKLHFRRK